MDRPLVLLVDDNQDVLAALSLCLAPLGVRTAHARDGQEAMSKVAELGPDVIVLDLILPRMSGAQVLTALRAAGNEIPVVVFSGVGRSHQLGDAIEFVPKPCDAERLRGAVGRALRR